MDGEHYCCFLCKCCTCVSCFERCGHKNCLDCGRNGHQPPLKKKGSKCNDYIHDVSYDNLDEKYKDDYDNIVSIATDKMVAV